MQHDIAELMLQVERKLSSEYERIRRRATEDPGTAGDQGEENWAELLRQWIPPSYHVATKGRIIGVDGEASPQIDVVVLRPSYPRALWETKLYLAAGVAAAFECKLTLKKHHIAEAIKTAKAIEVLADPGERRGNRRGTPLGELTPAIPYGILAHSHEWNPGTAKSHVASALDEGLVKCESPRHFLNSVCVADLGTWSARCISYMGPRMTSWEFDPLRASFPQGYASCAMMGPPDEGVFATQGNFPNIPFAQLCAWLTEKLAWDDPSMRTMADYFAVVGMHGQAQGQRRAWDLESAYSAQVRLELQRGRTSQASWSPWGLVL